MRALRLAILPLVGSLTLFGCGGETETNGKTSTSTGSPATVNEAAAKQVATQLVSAVTKVQTGTDGPGAAFAIAGAGQAAQGILMPTGAAPQARKGEKIGEAHQADVSGTANCTATSCTFTSYADSTVGLTWTIDGTISWTANHVACDLKMTGSYTGFTWNFHEVCDITVTPTSIDGKLSTDGSYSAAAAGAFGNVSWDSSVDFNNVTFNASGCLQSGSMDVDANMTSAGYSYSGSGSVTFDGSGC